MTDESAELDRLLQERAERLARRTHEHEVALRSESALVLGVGTDRVLLPSSAAREIVPLGALTPLFGAPAHIAGLTAYRGLAVPVFHLRALLGIPVIDLPETSHIVVLAAPFEPALAVDHVSEAPWPD